MLGIYDRQTRKYVVREAGCERGSFTPLQRQLLIISTWERLSALVPERFTLTGIPCGPTQH